MSSDSSPRVRSNEPPAIVLSVMNPIFRTMLGSPLTGRRQGLLLVHLPAGRRVAGTASSSAVTRWTA